MTTRSTATSPMTPPAGATPLPSPAAIGRPPLAPRQEDRLESPASTLGKATQRRLQGHATWALTLAFGGPGGLGDAPRPDGTQLARLMRAAAQQMVARHDFPAQLDDLDDLNLFVRLPTLALNQLVYEQLGGEANVYCGAVGGLGGLGSGTARAVQLNACLAPVICLGPAGRLRLREATYAVLMARGVPFALTQAPALEAFQAQLAADHPDWTAERREANAQAMHEAEVALPATARRLGQLLGEMMLAHRGHFNAALQAVCAQPPPPEGVGVGG